MRIIGEKMGLFSVSENVKGEAHCAVIVLGLRQRTNAIDATDFFCEIC